MTRRSQHASPPARPPTRPPARRHRAGFTLIELIVAGMITTFILGAISLSLSQIGRVKNTAKLRFDAFMRADTALNALRNEIIAVIRTDDLFFARVMVTDDVSRVGDDVFDRDEILIFNTRVRPLRNIEFSGEGFEYETQFRVADDDFGPVLWVRHDSMPDEYPAAGGLALPKIEGILGLTIEAYNGDGGWASQWDSDVDGLPKAIRVTVMASGHRGPDDVFDAPRAMMRTVIPIDRVVPPKDPNAEEEAEDENAEVDENGDGIPDGTDGDMNGGNGGNGGVIGGPGGPGGPGGGRPGGGGGRPGGGPGTGPRDGPGRGNGGPGTNAGGGRP